MLKSPAAFTLFLLGGCDLEMQEIKRILQASGFSQINDPAEMSPLCFTDKQLAWGASVEDYKEYFQGSNAHIYGIELGEPAGWEKPANYTAIDHHINYPPEPTSLQQVCIIISYTPINEIEIRRFDLISANDVGHIKGMQAINATKDEIQAIRLADRKAQGVTEAEEKQAELDIAQSKVENGITIVYTTLSHFSPITDRLQTERLIVYSNAELSYYGIGANSFVKDAFADLIEDRKAFYGGSGEGFFGLGKGVVEAKDILEIKDKIIALLSDPVSKHVFLFPFRWDYQSKDADITKTILEERINTNAFLRILKTGNWKASTYHSEDPIEYYNDATYFYEYVRTAIYTLEKEDAAVHNYKYELAPGSKTIYEIAIKKWGNDIVYKLPLSKILLNVYETGIAILSFHVFNFDYNSKEDVLRINDYGRRIYPQFLDTSVDLNASKSELIDETRNAFLAKHIKVYTKESEPFFNENFEEFQSVVSLKKLITDSPQHLPNAPKSIARLLGKGFKTVNKTDTEESIIIRPILDDRMFVICWYGNKSEVQLLKYNAVDGEYGYLNHIKNNFWTQFVFADNSGNTIQSKILRKKLAEKHTYDRWVDWNTLYGICRYAVVCLTDRDDFPVRHISKHVTGRYFEFIQLALAQRASVIKFSDETTRIAGIDETTLVKEAEFLHKAYMKFINRLNFSEVTAQEQGIEMYKMLTDSMEIDREIKTLNTEIDELHQFVNMREQDTTAKQATKLTKIATWFLPAGFILGLMSINAFDKNDMHWGESFDNKIWYWIFTALVLSIFAGEVLFGFRHLISFYKYCKKKFQRKN